MKKLFFLFLLFSVALTAQVTTAPPAIKWITFNQLAKMQAIQKRPVLVDVYTDWCGWCKELDRTTYADPNIVNYINGAFYAVKFNAESKDSINYLGKTYYNRGGGARSTHDLAVYLMGTKLSYPTTIFLNDQSNPNLIVPGYQAPNNMIPFLVYQVEHMVENTNINDFNADFHRAFSQKPNDSAQINWMSLERAVELQKKKPKKIFIHMKNDDFVSDRVMSASTFQSQEIIDSLNKNFYCVDFNVKSSDTVYFQNRMFVNTNPGKELHQLAYGLLQNQIGFPSVVLLNEQQLVIAPIRQYITEKHLSALLSYFNSNAYTSIAFPQWVESVYKK